MLLDTQRSVAEDLLDAVTSPKGRDRLKGAPRGVGSGAQGGRLPTEQEPPQVTEGRGRGKAVVQAVLDAALDELAAVGLAALSVERVAERAGVNKTTVYRRYPTKTELVVAAMQLHKGSLGGVPDHGNLRDDLIFLLQAGARFMSEPRGKSLFRMLMSERHTEEMIALGERLRRDGEQTPRVVLQRAIARGELAPDSDLDLILHTLFGPLIHRVFLHNDVFGRADAERLADIVLNGILLRPSSSGRRSPAARLAREEIFGDIASDRLPLGCRRWIDGREQLHHALAACR